MEQSSTEEVTATVAKAKRRWVKVDVDEDLFASLHLRAAESRMRIMPYLRRWLAGALPFESDGTTNPFTNARP